VQDTEAPKGATLTPRQRRCARYLALGGTQRATARRMGMDERSVRRWLADVPGFREYVAHERAHGEGMEDATDVLLDLLHSKDERVRLAAATQLRKTVPNPKPDDADADLDSGW
jgi:hypothetical protein